jgi:hypothetical protein
MKVQYLSLLLLMPGMQAMNQITPAQTDAQLVSQAIPALVNVSEELIPHLAATLKANPQEQEAVNIVAQAAGTALQSKVSKTNAMYISAGVSVLTAVITALASTYGKKC